MNRKEWQKEVKKVFSQIKQEKEKYEVEEIAKKNNY